MLLPSAEGLLPELVVKTGVVISIFTPSWLPPKM
jgi:hypothetical protein